MLKELNSSDCNRIASHRADSGHLDSHRESKTEKGEHPEPFGSKETTRD